MRVVLFIAIIIALLFYPLPSDAQDLEYVNSFLWSGFHEIIVEDDYAFCGYQNGLVIYDVSNPESFQLVSTVLTHAPVISIAKHDNNAYVAARGLGFRVIDLTDIFSPQIISAYDDSLAMFVYHDSGILYGASCDGLYWYGSEYTLHIFDVSEPSSLEHLSESFFDCRFHSLAKRDEFLYISEIVQDIFESSGGIRILNVLNPSRPVEYGYFEGSRYAKRLQFYNDYLFYLDNAHGLVVLDVEIPYWPQIVNSIIYQGDTTLTFTRDFCFTDNAIHCLRWIGHPNNLRIESYDISNPVYDSQIDILEMTVEDNEYPSRLHSENNLLYMHDFTYDNSPDLFLINATNPESLTLDHIHQIGNLKEDIELRDNYIFAANDTMGFSIFDYTEPRNPSIVWSSDSLWGMDLVKVHDNYLITKHHGQYNSDIDIFDITDYTNPVHISTYPTTGEISDLFIADDYLYICKKSQGLEILDITNPEFPVNHPFNDSIAYAYKISQHENYAYVSGNRYGLYIYDITDPSSPDLIGRYGEGYSMKIEEVAFFDTLCFVSDYPRSIVVLNNSDPANLTALMQFNPEIPVNGMFTNDNNLIITNRASGLIMYEISDYIVPEVVARYNSPGSLREVVFIDDYFLLDDRTSLILLQQTTTDTDEIIEPPYITGITFNFPNPFNEYTTISYALSEQTQVKLDIYDILGRKVETLYDGIQPSGQYSIRWNAKDVSSGIYFYKLTTGEINYTRKMLLTK